MSEAINPAVPSIFIWAESGGTPLPDGSYYAVFHGIEAAAEREFDGRKSPGMKWKWEVSSGPYKGRQVSRITGTYPTEKSMCGKVLAGMLGSTPKPGDRIDLQALIGKQFMVRTTKGYVESVMHMPPQ